jgi:hypothetical protein
MCCTWRISPVISAAVRVIHRRDQKPDQTEQRWAGIALFGWITLLADPAGLSLVFALAALAMAITLVTAPRSSHDSQVTDEPDTASVR